MSAYYFTYKWFDRAWTLSKLIILDMSAHIAIYFKRLSNLSTCIPITYNIYKSILHLGTSIMYFRFNMPNMYHPRGPEFPVELLTNQLIFVQFQFRDYITVSPKATPVWELNEKKYFCGKFLSLNSSPNI